MIRVSPRSLLHLAPAALILLALTGCSGRMIPPVGQTVSLHMQGKVHGGQQPVSGATIQLFDMSLETGNAATPLLGDAVFSDANGGFNITGDYGCPNGTDQVYLAATGGDPGAGTNNDLVMMTALGNCGDLSSATFISVNEVTTVATVWANASAYNSSETGGSNINGVISGAYQNFLNLVDPATGVAQTTNGSEVQLQLNALANSLSTCVNAATDIFGNTPECDQLMMDVGGNQGFQGPTNDSSQVIFAIILNPFFLAQPVSPAAFFMDAPPSPPFQPTLTTAPSSWDLGFVPLE